LRLHLLKGGESRRAGYQMLILLNSSPDGAKSRDADTGAAELATIAVESKVRPWGLFLAERPGRLFRCSPL